MSLLMTGDWSDPSLPWEEFHLQAAMARDLRRLEDARDDFTFAADMNGLAASSKRQAGQASLMGMRPGETDLRLYIRPAKLVTVEVKCKKRPVSKDQKIRHALLRSLGFDLYVVRADCPDQAIACLEPILAKHLPGYGAPA